MSTPYIMPDGQGGRRFRLTERTSGGTSNKGKSSGSRGKEEAWSALQARMGASSLEDLAELKAIERAGWRRRNRWFNDKALRDGHNARFGNMTAEDMQNQFNPPPFGAPPRPTLFSEVSSPENAALWEHFRSIPMDREQKVLDRWEEHNHQKHREVASTSGAAAAGDPSATAMKAWAGVSRAARTALKKANPHSVMELEHQVLDLIEAGDVTAELLMDIPDGFGRLLAHGLCEFHGLLSATRNVGGRPLVAVYFRKQQQQQRPNEKGAEEDEGPSQAATLAVAAPALATAVAAAGAQGHPEITCTDVLLALREAANQGGFGAEALGRFVRHMHVGSDAMSDDFVLV